MVIGHGAEAKVYKSGDKVTKERPAKGYRLEVIDKKLRKQRTRKEAKIIDSLKNLNIPGPDLLHVCDDSMKIDMSFIDGPKVRDVMKVELAHEIGRLVGLLHKSDIVHSDLTTSNMILSKDKIHLIDFGLSFISKKVEDKAVDLYLLERALESRHHEISEKCMVELIKGYGETYPEAKLVLERLDVVRKRGRNKK